MSHFGLVVMAYGTPATPEDIEPYYTHIRRGRPPTTDQLQDLVRRYDAIGGISPLAERTEAQRRAIEAALTAASPDPWTVVPGNKHAAPFIEDGIAAAAEAGAEAIVGLVLAPHFSVGSVGEYHRRAEAAAAEHGRPYHRIDSWHLEPAYVTFLVEAVREAWATLPAKHKVLFTAHSLPERILVGDPYPEQLRETAAAVADALGLLPWPDWALAWQSAGRTPEPWRGPDILDVIRDLGSTGRSEGVLVCPQGFTSDHLEVLYDLDVDATRVAAERGLAFARTLSLNDDPAVMAVLASLVMGALDAAPSVAP